MVVAAVIQPEAERLAVQEAQPEAVREVLLAVLELPIKEIMVEIAFLIQPVVAAAQAGLVAMARRLRLAVMAVLVCHQASRDLLLAGLVAVAAVVKHYLVEQVELQRQVVALVLLLA